jgi:hypothetical protein
VGPGPVLTLPFHLAGNLAVSQIAGERGLAVRLSGCRVARRVRGGGDSATGASEKMGGLPCRAPEWPDGGDLGCFCALRAVQQAGPLAVRLWGSRVALRVWVRTYFKPGASDMARGRVCRAPERSPEAILCCAYAAFCHLTRVRSFSPLPVRLSGCRVALRVWVRTDFNSGASDMARGRFCRVPERSAEAILCCFRALTRCPGDTVRVVTSARFLHPLVRLNSLLSG